jgi:sulfotransferase
MGQNPDFYVTPTSGVLELVYGARANFSTSPEFKAQDVLLMEAGFKEFCNKGIFGFVQCNY